MKTKKEIKPFNMRCESKSEVGIIENILKLNGCRYFRSEGDSLCVVLYEDKSFGLLESTLCYRYSISSPELTCSEFMKLYGEEEEVFTREDMKDFAYYVLQSAAMGTENECKRLLTKYLSERTND